MEIIEVSKIEFQQKISSPFHVFDKAEFNDLNKHKCEQVHYLLFKDHKTRLGIIGGINKGVFYSSFSAPFGGFSYLNKHIRLVYVDKSIDLLIHWCEQKQLNAINITLPPLIYNQSFITKQINCFYRKKFSFKRVDLNYVFFTKNISDNYVQSINRKSRGNLKHALSENLNFHHCKNQKEKKLAYDIILKHKKSQGYPMKLSWNDIVDTTALIKADFFLVFSFEEIPIAAALVFYVSFSIVQIIYWGDIREYSHLRPMNYLSYRVFNFYKEKGIEVIDLGPSSEDSVPNYGLCDFKEGIGCEIVPKYNFEIKL